jgi:phage major head subunit gpT-like protein
MGALVQPVLGSFFQQLDMRFQAGYQRRKNYWQFYANLCPSSTKQNVYSWLAELPGLKKWVGAKLVRNIQTRSYTLVNDKWEDSYDIDRDDISDDNANILGGHIELLGDAGSRWGDDIVTDQLIAATSTVCFDGQPFFSASHPVDMDDPTAGTYSNLLTTTALTKANYNAAFAAMQTFKGESGKPLEIQPTLLMVGPAQREIAMQIVNAELIAQDIGTAGGAVSNVLRGEVTLIINPRLVADTTGAWYLFSTDRIKPMIFQQREAPHPTQMVDPSNPKVFNQGKFTYSVEARGAAGVGLPFLAIKATP